MLFALLPLLSQSQPLTPNRLHVHSPGTFLIDYVRVWQKKGQTDVTCDPESHPTADYINKYMEYYTNRE